MKENKATDKLINLRPILFAACFLAFGIFCAFYSFKEYWWLSLCIIVAFAVYLITLCLLKNKSKKLIIFSLVAILFFSLGHLLVGARVSVVKNLTFKTSENEIFVGRVSDVTYYDSYIYVEFDNCTFRTFKLKGKTSAYIYLGDAVDKIDIGSIIECEANIVNRYLSAGEINSDILSGVYYELENCDKIRVTGYKANFYELVFLKARTFLRSNLSKDGYSIAIALLLGNTSYLPQRVLENYRFAGIAHVFAVSGLHVGVFVSIFTFFLNSSN